MSSLSGPPASTGPVDRGDAGSADSIRVVIAEQLSRSVRTVETHRDDIQQKLRLGSRSELVRYALDHHLVET